MLVRTFSRIIAGRLWSSFKDLLPIILVIVFFQGVVLRQPLPDVFSVLQGGLLVIIGLTLFMQGLEMGLFPIGEQMAHALARKGSLFWLLTFSFALGFSTTVAEPALIAVSAEAARVVSQGGFIASGETAMANYALGLRLSVAFSAGLSILIGVLRILKGWPVQHFIIGGYVLVMIMTIFAPAAIVGIAYDAGGVTTSTVTVPLVAALGIGVASIIKGRNPLIDGFGLIALAALAPIIAVIGYGLIVFG
ncbi:MAG: DUF1538 domain-containing protein [Pseudodesulfovibrio sp.]|uniref:DUF1538 domain-containing protein n=2 Tax=Desulfovibrionaceae TaxID=194924 RepID=E6VS28_PSEA9|nr:protein of unknown function DUF1538 [Pseudodesulfovibrio aespoeensis Aspo-2]MBU4378719.1 DUF1538 domain-containing protein [Pseudomonadota bacterium]MBV1765010.1 DUF1538 domain-containing protein [Pseudodesulfovibrio sp.]MBU4476801.1 DUF1538 domain-containing protein [Pseudomonadota bacterium]MBU4516069.1 DUF1538 domain-containing protein [Pseudomonadota bacterium]